MAEKILRWMKGKANQPLQVIGGSRRHLKCNVRHKMKIIQTDMERLVGQPIEMADFHRVRNVVLECCRKYGSVGGMGICPFQDNKPDEDNWQVENQQPDFFVVDDCLHPCQRYVRVDFNMNLLTLSVLESLAQTAAATNWAIWIGLADDKGNVDNEIVVLNDGIMVGGDILDMCADLSDVILECHRKGEQGGGEVRS